MRQTTLSKSIFCLSLFPLLIIIYNVSAFAACNHNWCFESERIETSNDEQHAYISQYRCSECEETKEDVRYEKHAWINNGRDIKRYSTDKHKMTDHFECPTCGAEKSEDSYVLHSWIEDERSEINYSDTQHFIRVKSHCSICREKKREGTYENHNWILEDQYSYRNSTSTTHSFLEKWGCTKCSASKRVDKKEKHHFDRYNCCKDCRAEVGKTLSATAGEWVYANKKSWIKIPVKKAGYLTINTVSESNTSPSWSLYNGSRSLFLDSNHRKSSDCVPVKKGTYYLQLTRNGGIKYSFSKDPSRKNYSKKKAIKLKKKKQAVTVIYANAKKKTWKRFYKIKLSKKQFLHLKLTEGYISPGNSSEGRISKNQIDLVTTSGGKNVPMEMDFDKNGNFIGFISYRKLKKGTYYVCLRNSWTPATKKRATGTVFSLSWN